MRYSGILGAILIIAMLIMGVWFGCKGEKEGGGKAQYEENIDKANEAVDQSEESAQDTANQAENLK